MVLSKEDVPPKTLPTGNGKASDEGAGGVAPHPAGVQGEGDYAAARAFNEAERKFVASGNVTAAAEAAAPKSEAEQREMLAAEEEGRRRAAGGPAPTKPWPDFAPPRSPGTDTDRKLR